MPYSGEDVPAELFARILDLLTLAHNVHLGKRNKDYVVVTKHELASCAIVCRYWAGICQRKIFERIRLKDGAELHQLIKFVDRPGSKLGEYVRELVIPPQTDPSAVPWIHLLPSLEPRLPQVNTYFVVRLTGPYPGTVRSVHVALPRAPVQLSRNIRRLELWDVRFRRLADLVHTLAELPDLASLQCRRLTWDDETELKNLVRGVPSGNHGNMDVFIAECKDNSAAVCIQMGTRRRGEVLVPCGELASIAVMARSIEVGIDKEKWARHEIVVNALRTGDRLALSVALRFMGNRKPEHTIDNNQAQAMPQLYALAISPRQADRYGHVLTIAVDFTHGSPAIEDTYNIDWETFDANAGNLPHLDTVLLGFATLVNMGLFVSNIARTKLRSLHSSHKLRYLVMSEIGVWMWASPGSDILKDSACEQLSDIAILRYL